MNKLQKLFKLLKDIAFNKFTGIIEIYFHRGGIREVKRKNKGEKIDLDKP